MRIPYISLVAAGAVALGGCAYGDLGVGMGYGSPYYGAGYGYGSPYYGYGSYGGYGGYGYGAGYGSYYGGYGSPYFGWYNNYYYPGSGYHVYDTYRRPHVMTTTQRQYWASRSPALRTTTRTVRVQPNWSGFNRRATARADRKSAREERRLDRQTRRNKPY